MSPDPPTQVRWGDVYTLGLTALIVLAGFVYAAIKCWWAPLVAIAGVLVIMVPPAILDRHRRRQSR